jgi:hypothetical protein
MRVHLWNLRRGPPERRLPKAGEVENGEQRRLLI